MMKRITLVFAILIAGFLFSACDNMIVDRNRVEGVLEEAIPEDAQPEEVELAAVEPHGSQGSAPKPDEPVPDAPLEPALPEALPEIATPNTKGMGVLEATEAWRQYHLERMSRNLTGSASDAEPELAVSEENEWAGLFEQVKVTRHIDGDTVVVTDQAGVEHRVRFIGVDAPETVHPTRGEEPFGREASAFTKNRLLGRIVYLEKDVAATDRFGRLLRYVWLEIPMDFSDEQIRAKQFNALLLLEGYATQATFPPNVKYAERYRQYEKEAREAGRGLWGVESVVD